MKFLRWSAISILVVGLFYLFFRNIHLSEVIKHIRNVSPLYLVLFSIGLLLQQVLRGYRWGIILRPRKQRIRIISLTNFTLIGFLINTLVPGRVGEPARGILMARKENIKSSHGLASVVIERVLDSITIAALFLVSLIILGKNQTPVVLTMRKVAFIALPMLLGVLALFTVLNRPGGFSWASRRIEFLVRIVPRTKREAARNGILHFIQGLRIQLNTLDSLKLTLSSIAIWLIVIPFYWILLNPMGIQATLSETLTFYCLLVAAASIPTPGMAGSLDAMSKLVLVSMLGANPEAAVAFTLLMHILLILVLTGGGFIALAVEGVQLKGIQRIGRAE